MLAPKMSITTKLILSFLFLALLAVMAGGIGLYAVSATADAVQEISQVRLASLQTVFAISSDFSTIKEAQQSVLLPGLAYRQREAEFKRMQAAQKRLADNMKRFASLELSPEEARQWRKFLQAYQKWDGLQRKVAALARRIHELNLADAGAILAKLDMGKREEDKWSKALLNAIAYGRKFKGQTDPNKTAFGRWLASYRSPSPRMRQALAKIQDLRSRLYATVPGLNQILSDASRFLEAKDAYDQKTAPLLKELIALIDQTRRLPAQEAELRGQAVQLSQTKSRASFETVKKALNGLIALNRGLAGDQAARVVKTTNFSRISALAAVAACLVVAVVLGFVVTRGIGRPLNRVVAVLTDTGQVVLDSGQQLQDASQSLAVGSSRQAASLEQTSASLEEISSMIRQNAEHAGQADEMMGAAAQAMEQAAQAMRDLREAMQKIDAASDQTAKIIKTIDEIAFQTNLLALNAAVEAARAGEAGAGFAVVADEVRNLALRAAEAASSTTQLIQENIADIKSGSELVVSVDQAFDAVREGSAKVGGLLAEIAAASGEQAQGIEQVSKAMSEVDKVTQQNAAEAEESAAAATQLTKQAENMLGAVEELVKLTGGGGKGQRLVEPDTESDDPGGSTPSPGPGQD